MLEDALKHLDQADPNFSEGQEWEFSRAVPCHCPDCGHQGTCTAGDTNAACDYCGSRDLEIDDETTAASLDL